MKHIKFVKYIFCALCLNLFVTLILLISLGCGSDKPTYGELKTERDKLLQEKDKLQEKINRLEELKVERDEILFKYILEKDKLQEKINQLEELKRKQDELLREKDELQERINQLGKMIRATIIKTTPSEGGTIPPKGTLTIIFDSPVDGVTIIPGFATAMSLDNNTIWTAKGIDLKSGTFTIAWKNKDGTSDTKTLNLKVGVADTTPPKVAASFSKDIFPILKKECAVIGCHVPPNPEGGLDQSSYDKLMRGGVSGKAVIAGNAADSLLVKRIEGRVQPLMPNGGDPLIKEDINKIKQWIDEGAKNN